MPLGTHFVGAPLPGTGASELPALFAVHMGSQGRMQQDTCQVLVSTTAGSFVGLNPLTCRATSLLADQAETRHATVSATKKNQPGFKMREVDASQNAATPIIGAKATGVAIDMAQ